MAIKYVDFNGGNDANDGSSFALRVKTLTRAAAVAAAGDTIRVMGKAPTSSGTATWTKGSPLVTLSSSLTQLLYANGAWTRTQSTVTATSVTSSPSPKEGTNCAKMHMGGIFATGPMAYYATGTLNLSVYQQVSLWVQSTIALNPGDLSIKLCSDTSGNTVVDTLPINVAINPNRWTNITLNKGSALGSSIKSIRIDGPQALRNNDVFIDNVVAAKATSAADCLTLGTLISPDNSTWYHVQSINGTSVYVDGQSTTAAQSAKGYQGDTFSGATFYMLQPTQVMIGANEAVYAQSFSLNGNAGNPVTISGGWDSTAMNSQTGWTTIDLIDWSASGLNLTGTSGYISLDRFNFARCAYPLGLVGDAKGYALSNSGFAGTGSISVMPSHGMTLSAVNFLNTSGTEAMVNIPETANYNADGVAWSITNTKIFGSTVGGIKVPISVGSPGIKISGCNCSGNGTYGFDVESVCGGGFFSNIARNNGSPGFAFRNVSGFDGYALTSHGNGIAQVQLEKAFVEIFTLDTNTPGGSSLPQIEFADDTTGFAFVNNWTQYTGLNPAAQLVDLGVLISGSFPGTTVGTAVQTSRENGNQSNNRVFTTFGIVSTNGVVGQGGSGIGWKLSPTSNALASAPLRFKIATVSCPANVTTTVSLYAKLSTAAGINARLCIEGGRYPGVGLAGSDTVTSISGTSWANYSISCRPNEDAEVDVFVESWGSSTEFVTVSGPTTIR